MNNPAELPFFVYGTLRPGEINHTRRLRGRTAAEEPAHWAHALLYEGPGYPYAVEGTPDEPGPGVTGALITAAPGNYRALLADLDELEEYTAPGHPGNLYERVPREITRADGTPVRAWVYLTPPGPAAALRREGIPIPGGDWCAHPVA
ncbi:gamma-glutamylcyclotransferase family protein [Streptomyces yaizuensis]|uniref:Gamma-glutamylcyclotransferase n=1 Tax=Streptomyces yaizuensis TaxID=2989713 RepID=A0ABQ5NTX4_9ACTN|nr:gamma-glutamylcyclotransferase family protein [Streptomyces sp. YSPA8]GLF93820.1 gamma-glutamylcyclotransferase [Streptomyces sp. YSPA8]